MGGLRAAPSSPNTVVNMSFFTAIDAMIGTLTKVFGTDVTYTRASDAVATSIKGVLNQADVEVHGVITKATTLQITLADLSQAPLEDDTVTIGGTAYTINYIEADALHKSATLYLRK
jgi:uncharacterized protein (DUF697 family)